LNFLSKINDSADLKSLSEKDLKTLCAEIRIFLIETILANGGHFSANLGVVEISVALNYIFNWEKDTLVWDVGHQSYVHKILNGRKAQLHTIRKKEGISGFPSISEHSNDFFGTGHSSTSISAITGFAIADELNKKLDSHHIAVIGDGSLTGGMAFEALNNLSNTKANVIVIINDNQMGIDQNKNGMASHLNNINTENQNIFENLGLPYHGPYDGHNLEEIVHILTELKSISGPQILHLKTIKGKGYAPAEAEQTKWHSVQYVKIEPNKKKLIKTLKIQEIFGKTLLKLAQEDDDIVAVTPAMPSGSSLNIMMNEFPKRVFDVGIAEQHAVTFSAGMALRGKKVFCVIYSSFLQRAFDQIIHDVALQNIPMVIAVDRAGLVGEDGATHQGVFDISFLKAIPNLTIISPMDCAQLTAAMRWGKNQNDGPIILRYPKGNSEIQELDWDRFYETEIFKPYRFFNERKPNLIISHGFIGEVMHELINNETFNHYFSHLDLALIKPLNKELIKNIFSSYENIFVIEESAEIGGVGEMIKVAAFDHNFCGTIKNIAIPDLFVEHATIEEQRKKLNLNLDFIKQEITQLIQEHF
jgi:1-deoxy-D-xylulose-5-phosphate synthase